MKSRRKVLSILVMFVLALILILVFLVLLVLVLVLLLLLLVLLLLLILLILVLVLQRLGDLFQQRQGLLLTWRGLVGLYPKVSRIRSQ